MTKRKLYSREEKDRLRRVCKCGKLTQKGVDLYTKLFDFPPTRTKGIERINGRQHAPTILGLVQHPAFKHWKLEDALNVVSLKDLKWRDPLTEPRNQSRRNVDRLVEEAYLVYDHFGVPRPSPIQIRRAMISRTCAWSPTKVDKDIKIRCDQTVAGVGSESINYTVAAKTRDGYDEKCEDLNELNKEKRRAGDEHRIKTNTSCRDHRRRKSSYRQIAEVNVGFRTGHRHMLDSEIEQEVESRCGSRNWLILGGHTVDHVMMNMPNFSMYVGITKQVPLRLEVFDFLMRGLGVTKPETSEMVPPITHPIGSYINVPTAIEMGFFSFPIFRSTSMYDCKRFEEKMQKRYEHLPYIFKRMYKRTGAGSPYLNIFSDHCCVYLTGIFDLQDLLDDGLVIVGDAETSRQFYFGHSEDISSDDESI